MRPCTRLRQLQNNYNGNVLLCTLLHFIIRDKFMRASFVFRSLGRNTISPRTGCDPPAQMAVINAKYSMEANLIWPISIVYGRVELFAIIIFYMGHAVRVRLRPTMTLKVSHP